MLPKVFSYAAALILTGVAVLAMPGSIQAHSFGGVHVGAAHVGVYRGGLYPGGFYHYGYPRALPRLYYGYNPYYSYLSGFPYPGYYYPYSGYYPYYSYPIPYFLSNPEYGLGSFGSYGYGYAPGSYPTGAASVTPPASSAPVLYSETTSEPDTHALVIVKLPADAQLWIDNKPTTSTGPRRKFASPPLALGSHYAYDLKATWKEKGHEVTQTQRVEFTAGAHVNVTFPVPSRAREQTSAGKHS
jgi:uncharacterized protein (TIGR03000 family)